MTTKERKRQQEAEFLLTFGAMGSEPILSPGVVVYTINKHTARSGMMRVLDCYTIRDDTPRWISPAVAGLLGYPMHESPEGITVRGCGMDVGFHLVYHLSATCGRLALEQPKRFDPCGRWADWQKSQERGQDFGYALRQIWL